jgi:hypothetical protein
MPMNRQFGGPIKKKHGRKDKTDTRVYSEHGHAKRMAALRHNQLLGYASLTQKNMYAIGMSDTTTLSAKRLAADIYKLCEQLKDALKTRIDPIEPMDEPDSN